MAIDLGTVDAFSKWLKAEKIESFDTGLLEQTAFAAAEKQFLENRKDRAVQLLDSYLISYPSGTNVLTAKYYLSEIYFENEDFEKPKRFTKPLLLRIPMSILKKVWSGLLKF